MITRAEAEAIASRWARGEADQRGYGCEPALAEFDVGSSSGRARRPTSFRSRVTAPAR